MLDALTEKEDSSPCLRLHGLAAAFRREHGGAYSGVDGLPIPIPEKSIDESW
jgi:hypothetical protein